MSNNLVEEISIVLGITALFGYLNVKVLKLPTTIGLMVVSLIFSLILVLLKRFGLFYSDEAIHLVKDIRFEKVVMDVMLSFLLFAGALHTDVSKLKEERLGIGLFSLIGVILSTFFIGIGIYFLVQFVGLSISLLDGLVFGALISPTDPIAVLGILKKAKVPKRIETNIVGESLFNDGVGVVVFFTLLKINASGLDYISFSEVVKLFLQEAVGGVIFGLTLGYGMYMMLKTIDNYEVEVIITIAFVMLGYVFANKLHTSGPLAMVVAGLVIGSNRHRSVAFSDQTQRYVESFWELVDILLNAILFVIIGFEILDLKIKQEYVLAALLSIILVLISRFVIIQALTIVGKNWLKFDRQTPYILTWGGLRGALSVALALTLPASMINKPFLVFITYGVVLFSIIVQGLSLETVAKKLYSSQK